MIALHLTITGVQEVIDELDRRLELMERNVERDLEDVGHAAAEEMIETHTFQNRTYHLETSITHEVKNFRASAPSLIIESNPNKAVLLIAALAEYASQVEFGHPGPPPARPYPFFWPVYFKWEPVLLERVENTVIAAIEQGTST